MALKPKTRKFKFFNHVLRCFKGYFWGLNSTPAKYAYLFIFLRDELLWRFYEDFFSKLQLLFFFNWFFRFPSFFVFFFPLFVFIYFPNFSLANF